MNDILFLCNKNLDEVIPAKAGIFYFGISGQIPPLPAVGRNDNEGGLTADIYWLIMAKCLVSIK